MKRANIALIGFMGVGKSIISNKLASLLNKRVVSTDTLIEKKQNMTIAQIFESQGEEYFRKLEREIVQDIKDMQNVVVDCGGGIVLNQDNIDDLKKNCLLVHLSASCEAILKRVQQYKHRPLLNVKDPKSMIEQLLEERQSFYEQADLSINTENKSVDQVCQELKEVIKND